MADQGQDARSLLELAVDIHTDINKLATGLAHAGANPQAIAGLQKMGVMVGGIAKVLGAGPAGGTPQPGTEAGPPAPGGPPAAPEAGPPQAGPEPVGPPQGARPGERPNALHAATQHLQAALAASKQKAA